MSSRRYDFHGLVRLQVDTEDRRAEEFFGSEYGTFRSDSAEVPTDLSLVWGRRDLPSGERRHSHKLLARWSYRIALGEKVELFARGNGWALPMVHHMMVHPALRWLASRRGALLLHAGAVVRDGRSLVILGAGGAGKTTTTALLLSHGTDWAPHADDYVFLQPDGRTLAYPTRSHLYHNLLGWVPALAGRLTPGERARLRLLWAVRRGSGERLKWPVRVGSDRLWPGRSTAAQAKVGAVLLLRRSDVHDPRFSELSPEQAPIDDLTRMNFDEARHFLRLVGPGGRPPSDEPWPDAWRERETEVLKRFLVRARVFVMEIPRRPALGPGSGRKVVRAIEDVVARGWDG